MTMAPRSCAECGQPYAPSHKTQRFCSVFCRGSSQERAKGKPATRDSVALDLVRAWSPARRARIRAELIRWVQAGFAAVSPYPPIGWSEWPETQLVGLIDKVSEEEKVA